MTLSCEDGTMTHSALNATSPMASSVPTVSTEQTLALLDRVDDIRAQAQWGQLVTDPDQLTAHLLAAAQALGQEITVSEAQQAVRQHLDCPSNSEGSSRASHILGDRPATLEEHERLLETCRQEQRERSEWVRRLENWTPFMDLALKAAGLLTCSSFLSFVLLWAMHAYPGAVNAFTLAKEALLATASLLSGWFWWKGWPSSWLNHQQARLDEVGRQLRGLEVLPVEQRPGAKSLKRMAAHKGVMGALHVVVNSPVPFLRQDYERLQAHVRAEKERVQAQADKVLHQQRQLYRVQEEQKWLENVRDLLEA